MREDEGRLHYELTRHLAAQGVNINSSASLDEARHEITLRGLAAGQSININPNVLPHAWTQRGFGRSLMQVSLPMPFVPEQAPNQNTHPSTARESIPHVSEQRHHQILGELVTNPCLERVGYTFLVTDVPDDLICPLSYIIFDDPVHCPDKNLPTVEKSYFQKWAIKNNTNPFTRERISSHDAEKDVNKSIAVANYIKTQIGSKEKAMFAFTRNNLLCQIRAPADKTITAEGKMFLFCLTHVVLFTLKARKEHQPNRLLSLFRNHTDGTKVKALQPLISFNLD